MFPPSQGLNLDIEALSGIFGSVSIACWIVVFSPQIIENFQRASVDGLSLRFILIWTAGDLANIIGAVAQNVLPTMIILAVYYALADIILICQFLWYRGFTFSEEPFSETEPATQPTESSALLDEGPHRRLPSSPGPVDGSHLSPATPLLDTPRSEYAPATRHLTPTSTLQTIFYNAFTILTVCAAGVLGWWISRSRYGSRSDGDRTVGEQQSALQMDGIGQVFGYLCAILYLGSRIPQILLNYRRKSTEGINLLFFLFACVGNVTYVLSIMAYSPRCRHIKHCHDGEAASIYWRYILVNFSWLLGSFGTLLLDFVILFQFFQYRSGKHWGTEEATENHQEHLDVASQD